MKNIYFPILLIVILFSSTLNAQNIGIGEAAPSTKLEIKGDGSDLLNVKDNSNDSKLFIDSDGKVGIGTTNPNYPLDVKGAIAYNLSGFDQYTLSVSNSNFQELTFGDASLSQSKVYRVTLATTGTGTNTGYVGIAWYNSDASAWNVRHVSRSGTSSNHPYLVVDANTVKARTDHASNYSIAVSLSALASDDDDDPNIFGADYMWQRVGSYLNFSDGNVGIPIAPSLDEHAANKKYVDDQVSSSVSGADDWDESGSDIYNNNAGNVGVGTNSPSSIFHVAKTDGKAIFEDGASGNAYIELDFTTAGSPQIGMSDKNNDNFWAIGADDADNALKFAGRTSGSIPTINGNTSADVKMTIQPGGNVGIGTTNPGTLLDIVGNTAHLIKLTRTGNNGDAGIEFHDTDANTQTGYFTFDHTDTDSDGNGASFHFKTTESTLGVILEGEGGYYAGSDVALRSNGNSFLTGGNLGVGTTSPAARVHTYTSGLGANTGATDMIRLELNRSDHSTTPSGPAILFKDQDTNNNTNEARIKMMTVNDTDFGDNDEAASNLVFETTNAGTASDKLIITGRGDIGIGIMNPSYKLHVNGRLRTNGINETSDGRLKKNVKSVENALDKVMALRGVNYEWRINEFPEKEFEEGVELGVIAQEIEKVLPEVVDIDNEGYKSVQYSHIVPVLIEAIKEQQLIIDEQKADLNEMAVTINKNDEQYNSDMNQKNCEIEQLNKNVNVLMSEMEEIKQLLQMSAKK